MIHTPDNEALSELRTCAEGQLDLSDLDLGAGSLAIRRGKGNEAGQVYLASGGAELLEAWLSVGGEAAGPLFVPVLKSGKLADRRLAPQSVRYVLQKRARAGIKDLSPHDEQTKRKANAFDSQIAERLFTVIVARSPGAWLWI